MSKYCYTIIKTPKFNANMNRIYSTWKWVPSLYFVEGIPYIIVTSVALILFKRMGLSDTACAAYTSWLALPWAIKPIWSPFIDIFKTKRWWIIAMQAVIGISLGTIAFTLPTPFFLQATLALFFLIAFSSATHDIAADGFYMLAQDEQQQALNVGVRSTFYRLAMIFSEGLLLMLIGLLEVYTRKSVVAWSWGLGSIGLLFFLIAAYHSWALPRVSEDKGIPSAQRSVQEVVKQFIDTFVDFFNKPLSFIAITFLLTYRLPEALLVKLTPLFLAERMSQGGLGLTTSEYGFVKGTIGVIGLTLGGIIGSIVVSRDGFARWKWPMALAMSLPNIFYVLLAYYQPYDLRWVNLAVGIEQFGYGFGFTLYMLYMLYFSQGALKTAHYAICTAFMALSMIIPGFFSGWIADTLGYYNSFIFVILLIPLSFWVCHLIEVPADFGRKPQEDTDSL